MTCRVLGTIVFALFVGSCGGKASDAEQAEAAPSTGGAPGTGGTHSSSGGTQSSSGGSPSTALGVCNEDADCIAAVDMRNWCEGGGCTLPIAASREDVGPATCLWDGGDSKDFEPCYQTGQAMQCPDYCQLCGVPSCEAGKCKLTLGMSFDECDALGQICPRFDQAWREAIGAANDCDSGDTFDCSQTVTDPCGCPVWVNGASPELVQAAQAAASAAAAAGCGTCTGSCEEKEAPTRGCNSLCWAGECISTTCQ